jgi:hypothetical protein
MRTGLRVLLLGCLSIGALFAAGNALAAFTPTIAVGHQPASTGASGTTSIRVVVPRDDDPLFKATIYVPVGYTATLNQPTGTQIGDLPSERTQVQVREPIAGAVLPLSGVITTDNPANHTTSACAPGLHAAVWLLTLSLAGQTLTVPAYVDPTSGAAAQLASHTIQVCLPSPNIPPALGGATAGAKLIAAQLNLRNVFSTPSSGATLRWHLVATPWPNTAGPPNVAGTVNAQGRVMLPARINLRATSRNGRVTITGGVFEGNGGVAQQAVGLRVGRKGYTVRTNAAGSFRLVVRSKRRARLTIRATANVQARSVTCSSPSPFPGVSCVSENLQFFVATRSITHRVR